MKKEILPAYLSFTKKERTGIIAVLLLLLLLVFLPFLFPLMNGHAKADAGAFKDEIAALEMKQAADSDQAAGSGEQDNYNHNRYPSYEKKSYQPKGELFYFDPNTITATEWQRLGVRDKTIATIQHYIAKGGRFNQPDDLEKIWGFFPDETARLKPYVKITAKEIPAVQQGYAPKAYEKKKYSITPVDINTADTAAFVALPGIGSKLAQRIVAFRDKLGGFYKVEQVGETFGLPDSTFQKIRPYLQLNGNKVRQIDINTATVDELKAHPYIRWNIANAIIQYRAQHGKFADIQALKNIMAIDEATFARIAPYVTVN